MSRGARQSRSHLPLPLRLPLRLPLPLPLQAPAATTAQRSAAPSPSVQAGSRRSPEVSSSFATDEPCDDVVDNDEATPALDEFEEKAFFVLGRSTRPRSWCITVVMWPYPYQVKSSQV